MVRRTRVKTCGITLSIDAEYAVELGIDALGFIFAEKSPRCISIPEASAIIKRIPPFVDRVGVFVNATIDQIKRCSEAGLSYAQLHGTEDADFCEKLRLELPQIKLLKAFRIGTATSPQELSIYEPVVDGFLLDTYVKGQDGGTGKIFDWSLIKDLHIKMPFLLAGGLSPDNVAKALETVQPYGVDINSGVEVSPGIKDHAALKKIMGKIRH